MSGIPVYTNSPINASKADGVTPQTATSAKESTGAAPRNNLATTTAIPSGTTYPQAQPGAPAVPAPTSAPQQRYAPVQPTPTTKTEDGPPAPQPGAFPVPPQSLRNNLPPPPKVGETYNPSNSTTTQSYPPQMSLPPPTAAYGAQPPSSSTGTTNMPSSSYPVSLSDEQAAPRQSLEHPPGYAQNPYAANLSASQRQVQEVQNTPTLGNYGSENSNATSTFGVDPESVWNTAKKWAQAAGEKLSEAEADIWKRVNGEK